MKILNLTAGHAYLVQIIAHDGHGVCLDKRVSVDNENGYYLGGTGDGRSR